uniref:Uncharacterized protein n=1 Tax=Podoviridae sp. ctuQh21 TaxID=2825284 RepID=A0A8S5PGH4_9CAUD|nr:MAG TPA: hypothetical protein [Podoviridae sp. ctuQh21]DAT13965.1 MAG TPA: hypothetical protein [Caudoviricetes sp.]DAT30086.1 MAG TPA: hypothetical protein [Caudoviricetes sp.]
MYKRQKVLHQVLHYKQSLHDNTSKVLETLLLVLPPVLYCEFSVCSFLHF